MKEVETETTSRRRLAGEQTGSFQKGPLMIKTAVVLSILAAMLLAAPIANGATPLELQLATINAGTYVAKDHVSVARFRSLLLQLDESFEEDQQQIADMSVTALQRLNEEGVDEKLLTIMEGMNSIFVVPIANQRYSEYAAAYVVLRRKGFSHVDAVGGLQGIVDALGQN